MLQEHTVAMALLQHRVAYVHMGTCTFTCTHVHACNNCYQVLKECFVRYIQHMCVSGTYAA